MRRDTADIHHGFNPYVNLVMHLKLRQGKADQLAANAGEIDRRGRRKGA